MSFFLRSLLTATTAVLLMFAGCGNDEQQEPEARIDRGPSILNVKGDPNGLWWDDESQVLYIADDDGNRLLKWSDADSFSLLENLSPAPESGAGLGQVVRTNDGTLVVTRFGHGTAGAVVFVPPSGGAKDVPNLAVERRRIGLTIASALAAKWWPTELLSASIAGYITRYDTPPLERSGVFWTWGALAGLSFFWGLPGQLQALHTQ